MIPVTMHRSPGICFTAEENPGKPQQKGGEDYIPSVRDSGTSRFIRCLTTCRFEWQFRSKKAAYLNLITFIKSSNAIKYVVTLASRDRKENAD